LNQFDCKNVENIISEFESFLVSENLQSKIYNLIYFDGNHSKKATLAYFDLLLPAIDNDSVWIFDDIHWSPEMEEAWNNIKSHPQVKVTIDTFQWGFVFLDVSRKKNILL
jgi:predicted O-methyltransferase YrrM